MAWNEPGGGRDPWGGNDQKGPPDLDEALKSLQQKLSGILGGRKPGGGGGGGAAPSLSLPIGWLLVGIVVVWGLFGLYIVDAGEEAVVTRFGAYDRTEGPGPHWLPPLIENAETVNVQKVSAAEIGFRSDGRSQGTVANESLMLTRDENIIDIKFAVQYRIKDARNYLFAIRDPEMALRQATESAVREIVGKNDMDFVITAGREEVADRAKDLIQEILDRYDTGLLVTTVNMQDAQPPAQVQEAFADAVKAREDEVRLKNEAEAYANDILPKARGDADAMRARASAYKDQVIAVSQGMASRFSAILTEYRKAPDVTRERLYLDAVESVLGSTSKILVGAQGAGNLLYLPLDKMMAAIPRTEPDNTDSSQIPFSTNGGGDTMTGSLPSRELGDARGRSR